MGLLQTSRAVYFGVVFSEESDTENSNFYNEISLAEPLDHVLV